MSTPTSPAPDWPRAFRAAADPVASGIDFDAPFADDAGHTRGTDALLLAWLAGRAAPAAPTPTQPDAALWHALVNALPGPDVETILARARAAPRSAWGGDAGALFPQAGVALEVWTETDLCALHALWWLGRRHRRADWFALVDDAVTWHLDNIQPDNATAHPWAIHLFARRSSDHGARLYAEGLLHNCQVSLGRPDRLSALILLDAARAMDTAS